MASFYLSTYSGYPTTSAMRVNVTFTVDVAGYYYTRFDVYDEYGSLYTTVYGNSYYLSAGGTMSGIYKTVTGLESGTAYTIVGSLWSESTGRLNINEPAIDFTTLHETYTYYARLILDGNGGALNDGSETSTFTGSKTSNTGSANVPVSYNCTFARSGYVFLGYSESPSATTAAYGKSGTYTIYSTRVSSTAPATAYLYAVWRKETSDRPKNWSWSSGVSKGSAVSVVKVGKGKYEAEYLKASEWNAFVDRICEFYEYKGLTAPDPIDYYVVSGYPMLASEANLVRSLINGLGPLVVVPAAVNSDSKITAAFLNALRDSLNSIT